MYSFRPLNNHSERFGPFQGLPIVFQHERQRKDRKRRRRAAKTVTCQPTTAWIWVDVDCIGHRCIPRLDLIFAEFSDFSGPLPRMGRDERFNPNICVDSTYIHTRLWLSWHRFTCRKLRFVFIIRNIIIFGWRLRGGGNETLKKLIHQGRLCKSWMRAGWGERRRRRRLSVKWVN